MKMLLKAKRPIVFLSIQKAPLVKLACQEGAHRDAFSTHSDSARDRPLCIETKGPNKSYVLHDARAAAHAPAQIECKTPAPRLPSGRTTK